MGLNEPYVDLTLVAMIFFSRPEFCFALRELSRSLLTWDLGASVVLWFRRTLHVSRLPELYTRVLLVLVILNIFRMRCSFCSFALSCT